MVGRLAELKNDIVNKITNDYRSCLYSGITIRMHIINDKLVYAISGPFTRNTKIFKGAKRTPVNV